MTWPGRMWPETAVRHQTVVSHNGVFDIDQIIQSIRSCDFTTYLDYDVTHAVMIMQELFKAFVKRFVWVVQTEFTLNKQKSEYGKHIFFFLTEW